VEKLDIHWVDVLLHCAPFYLLLLFVLGTKDIPTFPFFFPIVYGGLHLLDESIDGSLQTPNPDDSFWPHTRESTSGYALAFCLGCFYSLVALYHRPVLWQNFSWIALIAAMAFALDEYLPIMKRISRIVLLLNGAVGFKAAIREVDEKLLGGLPLTFGCALKAVTFVVERPRSLSIMEHWANVSTAAIAFGIFLSACCLAYIRWRDKDEFEDRGRSREVLEITHVKHKREIMERKMSRGSGESPVSSQASQTPTGSPKKARTSLKRDHAPLRSIGSDDDSSFKLSEGDNHSTDSPSRHHHHHHHHHHQ